MVRGPPGTVARSLCNIAIADLRSCPSSRQRLERQSHAVHAITQPGRRRAVVEDMAEMAAAAGTMDGCAAHAERTVFLGGDDIFERGPKAWPAGAAFELGGRGKQVKAAARAGEVSTPVLIEQRAGERPFGAALSQHRVLRRRQQFAPLVIRMR